LERAIQHHERKERERERRERGREREGGREPPLFEWLLDVLPGVGILVLMQDAVARHA
jgi:hypothetical protein